MKHDMVIFAANALGALTLKALDSYNTYPDVVAYKPGIQKTSLATDLSVFEKKFPITYVTKNTYEAAIEELEGLNANLGILVDWTKDFFKNKSPEYEILALHPSKLPLYRGYGAITEQFLQGVVSSAVSLVELGDMVDSGDMVASFPLKIEFYDYPSDFMEKAAEINAKAIIDILEKRIDITKAKPQTDGATYVVRKRRKDSIIDFGRDAFSIYNHIRAYSRPFFGAFFMLENKKYTLWRASTETWQGEYGEPGLVLEKTINGIEVACGSGTVIIHEIEQDGKIYKGDEINIKVKTLINT